MSRIFIIQKSKNKLKKWSVKEELPTVPKVSETTIESNADEKVKKRKVGRPVSKPKIEKKKYGKIIYFGQDGYRDYTLMNEMNKDGNPEKREEAEHIKRIYLKRHRENEDWDDLTKAGTWARYLIWNLPTMEESARDMEQRFNIKIILDKTPTSNENID